MYSTEEIRAIDSERDKAKSLALWVLEQCQEHEVCEYVVKCLPDAIKGLLQERQTKNDIVTRFRV